MNFENYDIVEKINSNIYNLRKKVYNYLINLEEYKIAEQNNEQWTLKNLEVFYNRDRVNKDSLAYQIPSFSIFSLIMKDKSYNEPIGRDRIKWKMNYETKELEPIFYSAFIIPYSQLYKILPKD